jgi:uncharacterized protein (DUF952 family)
MTISDQQPAAPKYIVHMAHASAWEEAKKTGSYTGDTLLRDGFIHFSQPDQLLSVANAPANPFLGMSDLILLYVDPIKLQTELKYEVPPGEQEAYPHLYGPLNVDAVIKDIPFTPGDDGLYTLPADLRT